MSDLSEAFGPAGSFQQTQLNFKRQRLENENAFQGIQLRKQQIASAMQRIQDAKLKHQIDDHNYALLKQQEAMQRIEASKARVENAQRKTDAYLAGADQRTQAAKQRMDDTHLLAGERIEAAHEHIGQLRQTNQQKILESKKRVALLEERLNAAQASIAEHLSESQQRIDASRQKAADAHNTSQQRLAQYGAITQERIDASQARTRESQLTAGQRRANADLVTQHRVYGMDARTENAQEITKQRLDASKATTDSRLATAKQKRDESAEITQSKLTATGQRTFDAHALSTQKLKDTGLLDKQKMLESGQRISASQQRTADTHATFGQRLENLQQSAKIRMQSAKRKWEAQDITDQLHQEQVNAKKLDVQSKLRSADKAERAEGIAESMDVGDDPVVNARVYSKKLWQAGLPASAMKADKQVAELTAKEMQARKQSESVNTAKLNTEHKQLVNNGLVMKDLNALFSSVKSPQDWERAKMLAAEQNLPNPYANLPYDPALVKQLKLGTDEGLKRIQIEQKERHLEGQLKNYQSEAKNRQSEEQFRTFRERAMNMKVQARGRVPAKSGGKEVAYPSKEAQKIAAQALKQKYPNLPDDELEHYAFDVASQAKAITSKNKGVDPGTALDRAMQQAEQQGDVKTVHHVYKGIFEKLNIGGILDKPDTQVYRPGEKAAAPKQPAKGSAPSAAVDYLKAHPELKAQFKAKYGYLPDEGDDGN